MGVILKRNSVHPPLLQSLSLLLDPIAGAEPKNHKLFRTEQPSVHFWCIAQWDPPVATVFWIQPCTGFQDKTVPVNLQQQVRQETPPTKNSHSCKNAFCLQVVDH